MYACMQTQKHLRRRYCPYLTASAPKICSRGIHPSIFIRSNQCPIISKLIYVSQCLIMSAEQNNNQVWHDMEARSLQKFLEHAHMTNILTKLLIDENLHPIKIPLERRVYLELLYITQQASIKESCHPCQAA